MDSPLDATGVIEGTIFAQQIGSLTYYWKAIDGRWKLIDNPGMKLPIHVEQPPWVNPTPLPDWYIKAMAIQQGIILDPDASVTPLPKPTMDNFSH